MMKKPVILLIIVSSLFPLIIFSQGKPDFVGQWYEQRSRGKSKERSEAFSPRPSDFARTKRYNLRGNINQLNSIMRTKPDLVDLVVPYGDRTYTLNLAKVEITAEDFNVRTNNGLGNVDVGVQYRGIVDNNPGQIASLNLSPEDKSAYFSTGEGNFVITKEGSEYIVYNDQVMELPVTVFCNTPSSSTPITFDQNLISGAGCKTVKVYFECDYAFYQSKGSNLTTITNYVTGFFNQVATLYANEDIAIQISEIFVWTSPDPYAALTTPSAILAPFRTNRGTNFNGNIAHFLTTRNISGGIAYVDALCNKAYAYGVSMIFGTYNTVPTYSWTVNVVAHELGHTFGSPHTHSCNWSGGPIDNCATPEGTCSSGPAPVGGGTIMSYCHMTSTGINFNNGFGSLPGNLIRSRVLNASCIPASSLASPPTSLNTTNITSNSATLSWAAAPSSVSYAVQYKLSTASTWTSAGTTTSTTKNISGLAANSNYVWTVKADCSVFAPNASFATTGASGCQAPTSLSTNNITQTGATLNWGAVPGATGYTVQYKTSSGSTWTTSNATTTSFNISGLNSSTSYVWQVKASCSSVYSSQVSFTTPGTTGCAPPLDLNAINITSTGATLTWSAVPGATGYTVQYKTTSASTWVTVNTTTTSKVISSLVANTVYTWQVKASCSGYSTLSTFTTTGTTGTNTCTVPTNLNAVNITSHSATLTWTGPANATTYTLRYRRIGFSGWTYISNFTGNTRIISGLYSRSNYEWAVSAKCSNGLSSGLAATRTFTTL